MTNMPPSENSTEFRELIQRAVAENSGAFDELAAAASERLRNLTRAMLKRYPQVKRWEDTDDVLQAAMLRLHRSLTEVAPRTKRDFFGLAATQIRRSLIDLVRHYYGPLGHGAHHHSQGGGKAADDSGGILANEANRGDGPETAGDWAAFHEAVGELPPDEQEVFTLVWYGGMLRKDVAALLDVADKTVMRRFNRARLKLQERLGPDALLD